MARGCFVIFSLAIFVLAPWANSQIILSDFESRMDTIISENDFNSTGFINSDTYHTIDGNTHVSRPDIYWTQSSVGPSMMRTGACSVAIPDLDQVWLMGGRVDGNPQQNGDELPTSEIEIYYNSNKTWQPAETFLPHEQQYCEAEYVDGKIFVIGEWNRNSNPYFAPTGTVQIYNLSNQTWYMGSQMPGGFERGLGGMAELDGNLYYAGGIRNSAATDHTNQTWKYDITNDSWVRMANMTNARSSFPLVNYHNNLYAIGGMTGTSTWNRQALSYVEKYDHQNDSWTNMSALQISIFGADATVYNDEIIIAGGFNSGVKDTVYHWNPIHDTWRKGQNLAGTAVFDLVLEAINGSIMWATGDISNYPYSNWGQQFSSDSEYQNSTGTHTGWITSPVIDLRPLTHSSATPVMLSLQGSNVLTSNIGLQYRTNNDVNMINFDHWRGYDGTVNSSYSIGQIPLNNLTNSNYLQYRINLTINDLTNWTEPDLDSLTIFAEHAGITSTVPTTINPRSERLFFNTTHYAYNGGTFGLSVANCTETGMITGQWSSLTSDGTAILKSDTENKFLNSSLTTSIEQNFTNISWGIVFDNMEGVSYICVKSTTNGTTLSTYQFPNSIEINRSLEVSINGINGLNIGDAIIGGQNFTTNITQLFPATGMSVEYGNLEARLVFAIETYESFDQSTNNWNNFTTEWYDIVSTSLSTISWSPPLEISGKLHIILEARSNDPFIISSFSNSTWLLLDNDNPIFVSSIPSSGSYIVSKENRHISIQLADSSGFLPENIGTKVWVESIDDGSDNTTKDAVPQLSEFRAINNSIEKIQHIISAK